MSTYVTDGQSLVDVVLQELGTVASLFDLADASGLAITAPLVAGQVLPVPASTAAVPAVVSYYQQRGHRVNTSAPAPGPAPAAPGDFSPLDFSPSDFQ